MAIGMVEFAYKLQLHFNIDMLVFLIQMVKIINLPIPTCTPITPPLHLHQLNAPLSPL